MSSGGASSSGGRHSKGQAKLASAVAVDSGERRALKLFRNTRSSRDGGPDAKPPKLRPEAERERRDHEVRWWCNLTSFFFLTHGLNGVWFKIVKRLNWKLVSNLPFKFQLAQTSLWRHRYVEVSQSTAEKALGPPRVTVEVDPEADPNDPTQVGRMVLGISANDRPGPQSTVHSHNTYVFGRLKSRLTDANAYLLLVVNDTSDKKNRRAEKVRSKMLRSV